MAGLFDKFMSEVQRTLAGGPSSADVGRFQQDAIAGGQRVLGLAPELVASAPTAPLIPEEVMSVDPAELMSKAPPLAEPTPATIAEPGLPSVLSIPKRSSRAKHATAPTAAAPVEASPPTPAPSTEPDAIANMLSGRRGQAMNERDQALAAAKAQENLTDDEKLAYALLGALPGLVGLIGGAAAGGGYGAAAGLAGGLQGGAQGMQTIANAKNEKRKELLARAEKAGDRAARVDDQELSHAERLSQQQFAAGQSDKEMKFRGDQNKAEMEARAREGAANRANALQLKRMDLFGDALKAEKAGAQGRNLTEAQERTATLLPTMLQANQLAKGMEKSLRNLPQASGASNALNSILPEALESEAYKKYEGATTAWTGSYLFKVSGAAVPPDEVKRYAKALFARPGDTPAQVQTKQAMRDQIEKVLRATLNRAPEDVQAALVSSGVPKELAVYTPGATNTTSTPVSNQQKYGF